MNKNQLPSLLDLENKNIEECIYTIRGEQVMLDSDVAYFFGVETKYLNRQMKRNIERFPEDFCFQINSKEFKTLRCQNVTFNYAVGSRKYKPYVYTEEWIIALAGVIKSDVAAKMSVEIARKFIQMRRFVLENSDTLLVLAKLQNRQLEFENKTNQKFDEILMSISKADLPKQTLFYAGQFYDAYEYVSDIIRRAKESIVLIDPYCDSKALTYLKNKKADAKAIIVTSNPSKIEREELNKFESQYGEIVIKQLDDNHDRYLIIDKNEYYNLGASLNYMGKKTFSIIKNDDTNIIKELLEYALDK